MLFVLTLPFWSDTKRIQQNLVLRKSILKPAFVLGGTSPPFESITGRKQLRNCHNTNQMFKCLCLAACFYLLIRALLSTNKFRDLRSKPKLEAKLSLVLPISPSKQSCFSASLTIEPLHGNNSDVGSTENGSF